MPKRLALVAVFLLSVAAPVQAQIAAAVVPPGNNGVLPVDGQGNGVFAVIAANLGVPPDAEAHATCSGYRIEVRGGAVTAVCPLDQATGACAGQAFPVLKTYLRQGEVGVYGVLVGGAAPGERIMVTFTEFTAPPPLPAPFDCLRGPVVIGPERGAVGIAVVR